MVYKYILHFRIVRRPSEWKLLHSKFTGIAADVQRRCDREPAQ